MYFMLFFVPTDMPDDDPGNRYDHKKRCKCHGHRITDDWEQQLVRPQGFYPEPSNPIPCQIQQKDFPIKPLVFSKQDQKDQKNQIPQGFIEKRGMYLDIRDTITSTTCCSRLSVTSEDRTAESGSCMANSPSV